MTYRRKFPFAGAGALKLLKIAEIGRQRRYWVLFLPHDSSFGQNPQKFRSMDYFVLRQQFADSLANVRRFGVDDRRTVTRRSIAQPSRDARKQFMVLFRRVFRQQRADPLDLPKARVGAHVGFERGQFLLKGLNDRGV